jgi:hypothetical protein
MGMIFQLQVPGFGNPVIQQAPYVMAPGKNVSISIRFILLFCLISGLRGVAILKVIFPKKPKDHSLQAGAIIKKGHWDVKKNYY